MKKRIIAFLLVFCLTLTSADSIVHSRVLSAYAEEGSGTSISRAETGAERSAGEGGAGVDAQQDPATNTNLSAAVNRKSAGTEPGTDDAEDKKAELPADTDKKTGSDEEIVSVTAESFQFASAAAQNNILQVQNPEPVVQENAPLSQEPEPKTEDEQKPDPVTATEPETVQVPEPVQEQEIVQAPEPIREQETVQAPEPVQEPVSNAAPEAEAASVPVPVTEPEIVVASVQPTYAVLSSEPANTVVMNTAPLNTEASGSDGSAAAEADNDGQSLQVLIMKKLAESAVKNKLSGRIQLILSKNTIYQGDKNEEIKIERGTYEGDFELELSAEDAGDDGVSGSGQTIIDANLIVRGIKLIMNSITMAANRAISLLNAGDASGDQKDTGAELTFNGQDDLVNDLTVKVGKNSSATINTQDTNDKIKVTAESGAKAVTVDAGDGTNTVDVSIGGGDLTLKTGENNDTVKVQISGKPGKIDVETGAGNDTLSVLDNGKASSALLSTGSGDDAVDLDVRAEAGNLTIDTGLGVDTVTASKGDFNTAEDLDYNHVYNPYETVSGGATTAVVTLKNGDENSVDRYTIDVAVSRAIRGITMEGGKGSSIYLKGILNEATPKTTANPDGNPIEWVKENGAKKGVKLHTAMITQTAANNDYTLEVTAKNSSELSKYNFTDALKNKKSVSIYLKDGQESYTYDGEQLQDFTDYVFKSPVNKVKKITFPTLAQPLMLSNVVLNSDETTEAYGGVINVNDVDAPSMNVLVTGRSINIKGEINAQNFRAESAQASKGMFDFLTPLTNDITSTEMFNGALGAVRDLENIYETAMINVEKGGKIKTTHDIDLVARIKQFGGILALAATLNVVLAKWSIAKIDIEKGAELEAKQGTVSAEAKIESISGMKLVDVEREGGNIETVWNKDAGMAYGFHLIYHDVGVDIEKGATVTAGEDVILKSKTDIIDYNFADADDSMALAATVILNDVSTTVAGKVTAGNNVTLLADTKIVDDTEASRTDKTKSKATNYYVAVSVIKSDVNATVEEGAEVTAERGNVNIFANSIANVITYAIAGKEKASTPGMPEAINPADLIKTFIKYFLYAVGGAIAVATLPVSVPGYILYQKLVNTPAKVAKKLVNLRAKLSGGDYNVKLAELSAENAEKGSATVEVRLKKDSTGDSSTWADDGGEGNLVAVITPTPNAGYRVKKIMVRYLLPGQTKYTYQEVHRSEVAEGTGLYAYMFALKMENKDIKDYEVIVEYEADDGLVQNQPVNRPEELNAVLDDVIDIGGLFNDVQEVGADAEEDDDGYIQPAQAQDDNQRTYNLKISQPDQASKNGLLLTWQQVYKENEDEYVSLTTVHGGDKIRFIGNAVAGKQLDGLEITYQITNPQTNQTETKTVKVGPNKNGQFVLTVPEDAIANSDITVKPVFGPKANDGVASPKQKTGTLAVSVVLNKGKATIESGSTVKAENGQINMTGLHLTTSADKADGTAVTEVTDTTVEETSKIPWTISKWTVSGAQYAVKAESTIGGTLEGTIDKSDSATFTHPLITFTPPAEGTDATTYSNSKKVKIVFSYYTKFNLSPMPGSAGTLVNTVVEVDLSKLTDQFQDYKPEIDGGALWEDALRDLNATIGASNLKIKKDGDKIILQPNLSTYGIMDGTVFSMNLIFEDGNGEALLTEKGAEVYAIEHPISINVNGKLDKTKDHTIEEKDIKAYGTVDYHVGNSGNGKYYFTITPAEGYKLDADGGPASSGSSIHKSNTKNLYASWKGSDGAEKKAALKRDETGDWYLDINDGNLSIPEGVTIRICANFEEDTRKVVDKTPDSDKKIGSFEIYDEDNKKITDLSKGVKAGEALTIKVTVKDGYGVSGVKVKTANGTEKILSVNADGKSFLKIDQWDDTTTPDFLYVQPIYVARTRNITKDDKIQLSIGNKKTFTGEVIRVLPSDESYAAGLKVTSVTVNGVTTNSDWITVPEGADAPHVSAQLARKAYEVKSYKHPLDRGEIKCATAYVDGGEIVDVKVNAKEGYHAKAGTVKAIIKYQSGGEKKVSLTWTGVNTYRLVVPSEKIASIELVGEFEEGQDEETSSTGIAIGVSVVRSENKVEIEGGKITAGNGINMTGITMGNKASTVAKAGYNKGATGFAGALAVQVASEKNKVIISKDEDANGFISTSQISLNSSAKQSFETEADASGTKKDAVSEKTGIGAGVAVAIDRADTVSRIEDGVRLNPDQTEKTLSKLTVKASLKIQDKVKAVAGAAGGTSIVPVIAVDVYQGTVEAEVGKFDLGKSDTLKVTGPVKISAKSASPKVQYNHEISADASANGGKSAIGAAIIVDWVKTDVQATLKQSLDADSDVTVSSHAADALRAVATSSAAGGVKGKTDKNGKGSADKQADKAANGAGNMAGRYGGMDGGEIRNNVAGRQKAETAESTVAGAGALVLNMQKNFSNAEIPDGVNIKTAGKLAVQSENRTEATIKANASATKATTGVGVGVALNLVDMENIARIGNGTIEADELEVTATIAEAPTFTRAVPVAEGKSNFRVQLEKTISDAIKDTVGDNIFGSIAGDVVGAAVSSMADQLITDLNLQELFDVAGDTSGILDHAADTMVERFTKNYWLALANPFIAATKEVMGSVQGWNDEMAQALWDDVSGFLAVQVAGDALQVTRDYLHENFWTLINNGMYLLNDVLTGKGYKEGLKKVGTELKTALKNIGLKFINKAIEDGVTKLGATIPLINEHNKNLIKSLKDVANKNLGDEILEYTTKTFREQVWDYSPVVEAIEKNGIVEYLKKELYGLLNAGTAALTNEAIDKLVGVLDVKYSPEPIQDRHIITTQAIAGAGGKEKSGTGSLAIAVADMETRAEIAGGNNPITVNGNLILNAEEVRRIRTHATAAVDARGEADNNEGVGDADNEQNGSSNAAKRTFASKDNKIVIETGKGGKIKFNAEEDDIDLNSRIDVELQTGYKWPADMGVSYTYTDENGAEVVGRLILQSDAAGKRYFNAGSIPGFTEEMLNSATLRCEIEFQENLRELPASRYVAISDDESGRNYKNNGGKIDISIEGREAVNGIYSGVAGELGQITVKKVNGLEVSKIQISGNNGQIYEYDVNDPDGVQIMMASDNSSETVYVFKVPDQEVTGISVGFRALDDRQRERQEQNQNVARDKAGRTVGVGLAFAWTTGESRVVSQIGTRAEDQKKEKDKNGKEIPRTDIARGRVEAGTMSITASSEHEEQNFATAGTDPIEGTSANQKGDLKTEEKDIGVDAAGSVNKLDNKVYAGITKGTTVVTTGKAGGKANDDEEEEIGEDEPEIITLEKGDLIISATEISGNETKSSAFSTGTHTAAGASVAVNISRSNIDVKLGSGAEAAGKAVIRGHSLNQDRTWSFASAVGAEMQRVLNKGAEYREKGEEKANEATRGELFGKNDQKKPTKTGSEINQRLNENKQQGGDDAANDAGLNNNVLRINNVQNENGEQAQNAVNNDNNGALNEANRQAGINAGANDEKDKKEKRQVAATVGYTEAKHNVAVNVGGSLKTGTGDIRLIARNAGNFNTRATAVAMTKGDGNGGRDIAFAAGISVSKNTATIDVEGSLISDQGDVAVDADLTQNQTGRFKAYLAVQAIGGAFSGTNNETAVAGAVSWVKSEAETHAIIKDAAKIAGNSVTVDSYDKSRLASRAGAINISTGAATGLGFSAAVILSENKVKTEIGSDTTIEADKEVRISAEKAKVTQGDWEWPIGADSFITDTSNLTDEQRDNVRTGLIDVHRNPGEKSYTVDINVDSYALMNFVDNLNYLSAQNYYAEAIGGSVVKQRADASKQNKRNTAGSFSLITIENQVDTILGDDVTIQKRMKAIPITASAEEKARLSFENGKLIENDVTISATDDTTARLIAGAISGGKAKSTVGVSINYFQDSDKANTTVGKNMKILSGGKVAQKTEASTEILNINIAAAINTEDDESTAKGGGFNVILLQNKAHNTTGDGAAITGGSLDITADANMLVNLISVSAMGAKNGTARGGTVAWLDDQTEAKTKIGKDHLLTAKSGDIRIKADAVDKVLSVAASASAGMSNDEGKGKSFAGTLNIVHSGTKALVELKAAGSGYGVKAEKGSVDISAETETRAANATLTAAYGKSQALGLNLNFNFFTREAKVDITGGDGYEITAGKDVKTSADGIDMSVLAALAVTAGKGTSMSGNVPLLVTRNTVTNTLGNVKITAGGAASFTSTLKDRTYAVAGNVALTIDYSKEGDDSTAAGAAAMFVIKQNTVKTDMGTSFVHAKSGDILVRAKGSDHTYAITAGVTVSSSKNGATFNVVTSTNNNTIYAEAGQATLNAVDDPDKPTKGGSVTVEAIGDSLNWAVTGGLNVSAGNSVGAALIWLTASKDVKATAHNINAYKDVVVNADNTDKVNELSVNVGASTKDEGTLALDTGFSIQILKNKVNSAVASQVKAKTGGFTLKAKNTSNLDNINIALAVAKSKFTLTPVFALTYYGGETNALLAAGTVDAAGAVNVIADAHKDIDQYTIGASMGGGKVAASGAVSLMFLKDSTNALVNSGTSINAGSLNIEATGNYDLTGASAALAGNYKADGNTGAVNVIVTVAKANVLAEMEGKASVTGAANIKATAKRDIVDVALTVAGGGNAGAGVTVMSLVAGDKMDKQAADMLAYGSSDTSGAKAFDSDAMIKKLKDLGVNTSDLEAHEETPDPRDRTVKEQKSGITDDLSGNKNSNLTYSSQSGQGFDATSGMADQNDFVTDTSDMTEEERERIQKNQQNGERYNGGNKDEGKDAGESADVTNARGVGTTVYSSNPDDAVVARIAKGAEVTAHGVTVAASQDSTADLFSATVGIGLKLGGAGVGFGIAILRSNVIAASLGTVDVKDGNMNVIAESTSGNALKDPGKDATAQAREDSLKNSMEDEGTAFTRSLKVVGIAAGGGKQGVGIAGSVARADNITEATVGGTVKNVSNLTVSGTTKYDNILAVTVAAAGGLEFAVAASVAVAIADGDVSAKLDSTANISGKNTQILVTTNSMLRAKTGAATVGGGGKAAITGGISVVNNKLRQNTSVDRGAVIDSTGDEGSLKVKAISKTYGGSMMLGAQFAGKAAVGLGLSIVNVNPEVHTTIGVNEKVGKDGKKDESAAVSLGTLGSAEVSNDVESEAKTWVASLSGAGKASVAANVLLVFNDTDAESKIANTSGKLGSLRVAGNLDAEGESIFAQLAVGGYAGVGASVSYVDVNSQNKAVIDTDNSTLNVSGPVQVVVNDIREGKTSASATAVSANAGAFAGVSLNAAAARNRAVNAAIINGKNGISGSTVTLKSNGKADADAFLIGLAVGLGSINGAVTVALNEAVSLSQMKIGGALEANLDTSAKLTATTHAHLIAGSGSIVGLTVNVSKAKGTSQALVDVDIGKAHANPAQAEGESDEAYDKLVKKYTITSEVTGSNDVQSLIDNQNLTGICISVMVGVAYANDTYDNHVVLRGGDYKLTNIGVTTEYTNTSKAVVTPSASGVSMAGIELTYDRAEAKGKAYGRAQLEIVNGSIASDGDVNVTVTGTGKADAGIADTTYFSEKAVSAGGSYAYGKLATSQAAVLKLDKGKILKAAAVNVKSLTKEAFTGAAHGANGADGRSKPGFEIVLGEFTLHYVESKECIASTAMIEGGGSADNKIKAKSLTVRSGMTDDGKTSSTAISKDNAGFQILSVGGLNTDARSSDQFYSQVSGVDADIAGGILVFAKGDTEVTSSATAPGDVTVVELSISYITAGVGDGKDDRQTAQVLIGNDTKLKAGGNINLYAENNGYTYTKFQKNTFLSAASAKFATIPTDSYYNTGVTIGQLSELTAGGDLNITSNSHPRAESKIDTFGLGVALDLSVMKGSNKIDSESNIDIGAGTQLKATGDVLISGYDATYANAKSVVRGGGLLLGGEFVDAENVIERDIRIAVDHHAHITSVEKTITLQAISGMGDNIVVDSYVRSGGLIGIGTAKATNKITSNNLIDIGESVFIEAKGNITLLARATSRLAANDKNDMEPDHEEDMVPNEPDLTKDEESNLSEEEKKQKQEEAARAAAEEEEALAKIIKASEDAYKALEESERPENFSLNVNTTGYGKSNKKNEGFGIYSKAQVLAQGVLVWPEAVATVILNFNNYININQEGTKGANKYTQIKSSTGDILIRTDNEGLRVKAESIADGGSIYSTIVAKSTITANLQNTIWIDYANLYADGEGKSVYVLANNFGDGERPYLYATATVKNSGVWATKEASAVIDGYSYNQIKSTDPLKVYTRGNFIHIALNPADCIDYTVDKNGGKGTWAFGAASRRCDFCDKDKGQSQAPAYDANTNRVNLQGYLALHMEKALVPLNDIERRVNEILTGITKARYGEEDYAAASKIYVLELPVMLEKDVTLDVRQLKKYKLWTNTRTQHDVYLLPNATRIYGSTQGNRIKPEYIVETFRGDLIPDGREHDIDVICALTQNAFMNAVIPVGSTGSLDFRTGTLTIPDQADFEVYLEEVSGSWMVKKIQEGFLRALIADQDQVNDCALNGSKLPEGKIMTGLTEDGEVVTGSEEEGNLQTWKKYWLGDTPETAGSDGQTLIFLLVNEETDEVDAFRTSRNMIANGEEPVDVSLYLYRDTEADLNEEEKYNVMFFDTPEGEQSLVKIVTTVLSENELETPLPMRITLRSYRIGSTGAKMYSMTGHQFVLLDLSDGEASLPELDYKVTFDGDVYESDYIRIEGIESGDLQVTLKKDQPIWAEWVAGEEDTAEDLNGYRYKLVNGVWYREEDMPVVSSAEEPDAA